MGICTGTDTVQMQIQQGSSEVRVAATNLLLYCTRTSSSSGRGTLTLTLTLTHLGRIDFSLHVTVTTPYRKKCQMSDVRCQMSNVKCHTSQGRAEVVDPNPRTPYLWPCGLEHPKGVTTGIPQPFTRA